MTASPDELILALVREIPPGRLASYGQIADYLPGVRARRVGHVLAGQGATPDPVPWQRVINAQGAISAHPGAADQRKLLETEGIEFSGKGRISWDKYRWHGPSHVWMLAHGLEPME